MIRRGYYWYEENFGTLAGCTVSCAQEQNTLGIRFTPSDQVLLLVYLKNKNRGLPQPIDLIHEYNIYTCRPDLLPRNFCYGKGNELYFFVTRDLTKSRMKRTVENGYGFWRSTGNIAQLRDQDAVIGEKRTFNFLIVCEPKPIKTNWVMKEYNLASESSLIDPKSSEGAEMKKVGFVLCKIYENKKASDENQGEEEQMTEMSIGDGPNNSDSDAGTENLEDSTSLPFDENQMTDMPQGDYPINADFPSLGCDINMEDPFLPSEENQMTGMPLGDGLNITASTPLWGNKSTEAFEASQYLAFKENQITEMPLGDGLDVADFPLCDTSMDDLFFALEKNQMTRMPLGNGPNNPEPFPWDAEAAFEPIAIEDADFPLCDTCMDDLFLALDNNPEPFWSDAEAAFEPIAFEENQMTEMPLRDAPNSSDG